MRLSLKISDKFHIGYFQCSNDRGQDIFVNCCFAAAIKYPQPFGFCRIFKQWHDPMY